jgi:hypothetical protein
MPTVGESIYLHCFRPTYGQQVVLEPSEVKDAARATPPNALLSLKVQLGGDFEVRLGELNRGYWLSGKTSWEGERLMASFKGMFGSSIQSFNGPVELEKVFDPNGVLVFASGIHPFRCVFSRHQEMKPFLDAQIVLDEKRLAEATETTRINTEIHKLKAEQDVTGQPANSPEAK